MAAPSVPTWDFSQKGLVSSQDLNRLARAVHVNSYLPNSVQSSVGHIQRRPLIVPDDIVLPRIIKSTASISSASDSGGVRTPALGLGDLIKGTGGVTNLENWSLKTLTTGTYLVVIDIGGDPVIITAFC